MFPAQWLRYHFFARWYYNNNHNGGKTWRIKFNGPIIYGLGGHIIILFADNLPELGVWGGCMRWHRVALCPVECDLLHVIHPPPPTHPAGAVAPPSGRGVHIPATVVFRSTATALHREKGRQRNQIRHRLHTVFRPCLYGLMTIVTTLNGIRVSSRIGAILQKKIWHPYSKCQSVGTNYNVQIYNLKFINSFSIFIYS